MLRLQHTVRLGRDLLAFALVNRVWWFLPIVVLLGLSVALAAVGSHAVLYTIYTLF